MLALDYLRSPEKIARPIYALFGDDAYLRRESLHAVVALAIGKGGDDLSVSRFAGDSTPLSAVLDEVRTLPFLAKARVAIVEEADKFVTAHRKELENYAEKPASSGILVLSVKSWPGTTKLAKLVEKSGLAIDCKSPSEKDLPRWIVGLAKVKEGVVLDEHAARMMVDLVGPEVGLLVMELGKLASYVGARKSISADDVAVMVDAGRVRAIWAALDAATTGRGDEALAILDSLLSANEPPQKMIAALASSLLKTHHAGMLRRSKKDAREACREAGIPPFAVENTIKQHAHLGPDRVSRLPRMLLRADLDMKGSSQLPPRVVLERLIVELASPRKD